MLRIHPFKAIRPSPGFEARVASLPYDVVTTEEARELARDNPYSFLHVVRSEIDLPPDTNPYDARVYLQAKETFERFQREGVLMRDTATRFFLYRQAWRHSVQVGLLCCCHVDDYEKDIIKKHERTRQVKEDDRTRHVLTLNANAGPVFLAYRDVPDITALMERDINTRPLYHFTAVDGVTHSLWPVDDWESYARLFAAVPCAYVADGHHRAASAWRAGQERRKHNPRHTGKEEYNWFLSCLFPASHLRILPYNRVVKDLHGLSHDEVLHRFSDIGEVAPIVEPMPRRAGTFGFYLGDRWRRLTLDESTIDHTDPIGSLDVSLLQDRVLTPIFGIGDPRTDERIDFVGGIRGPEHLERLVQHGEAAIAFTMFPTTMEQLMAVADAGLVMPPKSTWFEPKLRSGLVVHTLD